MKNWWREAVFYEIYMPSYCDGNGDGIGDFKGMTSKLDYLKELGVNGIWLTPFYKSPKVDNGYDIEDYYDIDSDYGTLEDFKIFLSEAHERGIKVIADLVLNHTSDKHKWFLESKTSIESEKRDWYIWKAENEKNVPNNWESFFRGTSWEYDETTSAYYYHAFAKEQVDLNWNNPKVKEAMFQVVRYWLDLGIDGFRLDVINFLKTEKTMEDNPYDENNKQLHINDKDQKGTLAIIKELRELVDSYGEKFLVGEVGSDDLENIMKYTGEEKLHVAFNFNLGSAQKFDASKIYEEVKKMDEEYADKIPTLFFGSHDMSRFISRFSDGKLEEEKARLAALFMITAKGVPFIYYGEEIGMRDFYPENIEEMRDIQGILAYKEALKDGKNAKEAIKIGNNANRDKSRTPMQWDDTAYSGFSSNKPWISIPKEWADINVLHQKDEKYSMINYYKKLIALRKKYEVFQYGHYKEINMINNIVYYLREKDNEQAFIIMNFSNLTQLFKNKAMKGFTMKLSSRREKFEVEESMNLLPYEAIILYKKQLPDEGRYIYEE